MGREIRKVPADWEHPKDADGHYRLMHDQTYQEVIISYLKDELSWYLWPPKNWRYIKEWFECWPNKAYYRPKWDIEPSHYQIYENVTEGTPVSPIFASKDDLTDWLIEQGHSRKASERFAKDEYVPSMVMTNKGIFMGIDALDIL